jgi:hypothetical protein
MGRKYGCFRVGFALCVCLLASTAAQAAAQGRSDRGRTAGLAGVRVSAELEAQIRDFYGSRPESGAAALPPGIRRNLERGKPLPPGIAKKVAPGELRSRIELAEGYELVEVGLDVLLVEVATQVVHDVLMDVIR